MKKIIITAPFGATFKNLFLNEHFLGELLKNYNEVHILTPIPIKDIEKIVVFSKFPNVFIHNIPEKFNVLQMFFSQASIVSFNKLIKSGTFGIKLKDKSLNFSQKLVLYFCCFLNILVSWRKLFFLFDYFKFYFSKDKNTKKIIQEINPQLVFVTAPSFRFDFSIIKEALDSKLPVIGMVHSWDNLSSKGPVNDGFSKILVWNKFQFDEIKEFYPNYKDDQIDIVGIPQLDYYLKNKSKLKREDLESYLKIESDCKIITYTTGTHPMIPYENCIVESIIKELSKTDLSWHMLIRLHPRDDIKYYENLKKYKNVTIETVNKNKIFLNDGMGFQMEDIIHYGNILKNSDVILNIISTVFLESLIMGTPSIGVAFDEKNKDYYKSIRRYYDFNHAKYLLKLEGAYIAYSPEEIVKKIKICLTENVNSKKTAYELAYLLDGDTGKRIADILNSYSMDKI